MSSLRTAADVRAEFQRKGVSISSWAIANGFSTNLVFEVLAGRKKCLRGQAHNIAVKLGLKVGEICTNPANAIERRAGLDRRAA
jgi:gp16 family phage-associated protein